MGWSGNVIESLPFQTGIATDAVLEQQKQIVAAMGMGASGGRSSRRILIAINELIRCL